MPSLIHDSGAMWLYKNFSQAQERWFLPPHWLQTISMLTYPTFGNFLGDFQNHQKGPDCALIPLRQDIQYPTIVLETGYSESSVGLENDAWLWHLGTGGAVRVVLLLKIYRRTQEGIVRATLSVWQIRADGVRLLDHYPITAPPLTRWFPC
ncbi:hypothetical protein HOY82DRAFT_607065 [Tuber indicum]|nr:hypothetical protein HOY82DRAFT_607065 [Tuber indicum]